MELADLTFLTSDAGQRLLAETAAAGVTADNHLQLAALLRQKVAPERVHAVLETVTLRQRAAAKFSRADRMYFTRPALEQASAEIVARHRAGRFAAAGFQRVADLGCGIGGDSLALAAVSEVIGVERDGLRLAMAQENVAAYGGQGRFQPVQADLMELTRLPGAVEAFFADPARRDDRGRRFFSVHDYRPPLARLLVWQAAVPDGAIKISPGVDYGELPAAAEVEFVSLGGEVREAVLWLGRLRGRAGRRATLLPGGHTLSDEQAAEEVAVLRPLGYLLEPDGAVIRAHLVEQLAISLGAAKIDDNIAYLTADHPVETPFARTIAVEDVLPFQLKRLRNYLRQRQVGRVTIKKRGSPLDAEELRTRLRLQGAEERILFLTRVMGEPAVVIGRELSGYRRGESQRGPLR